MQDVQVFIDSVFTMSHHSKEQGGYMQNFKIIYDLYSQSNTWCGDAHMSFVRKHYNIVIKFHS